jgi:hypothetical protein
VLFPVRTTSHPEFKDEVRELSDRVLSSFKDWAPEPRSVAFEEMRRRAKDEAEAEIATLSYGRRRQAAGYGRHIRQSATAPGRMNTSSTARPICYRKQPRLNPTSCNST